MLHVLLGDDETAACRLLADLAAGAPVVTVPLTLPVVAGAADSAAVSGQAGELSALAARISARPLLGPRPLFVVDGLLSLSDAALGSLLDMLGPLPVAVRAPERSKRVERLRDRLGERLSLHWCVLPRGDRLARQVRQDVAAAGVRADEEALGALTATGDIDVAGSVLRAAELAGLKTLSARQVLLLQGSRQPRPSIGKLLGVLLDLELAVLWQLARQVEPVPATAAVGALLADLRSDADAVERGERPTSGRLPSSGPLHDAAIAGLLHSRCVDALGLWLQADGQVKAAADPSEQFRRFALEVALTLAPPAALPAVRGVSSAFVGPHQGTGDGTGALVGGTVPRGLDVKGEV